jgi:Tol biopolymer transport system component
VSAYDVPKAATDQRAVFIANRDNPAINELYSAPLDGSAAPVKLSGAIVTSGNVSSFKLSDDGQSAVFFANKDTNGLNEIYSVPIAGGMIAKLSGMTQNFLSISSNYVVSGNSTRVAFTAFKAPDFVNRVYVVAVGSANPVQVSGAPATSSAGQTFFNSARDPTFSPDSKYILYRTAKALYATPVGGGNLNQSLGTAKQHGCDSRFSGRDRFVNGHLPRAKKRYRTSGALFGTARERWPCDGHRRRRSDSRNDRHAVARALPTRVAGQWAHCGCARCERNANHRDGHRKLSPKLIGVRAYLVAANATGARLTAKMLTRETHGERARPERERARHAHSCEREHDLMSAAKFA